MAHSLPDLLAQIHAAAVALGDPETIALIEAVQRLPGGPKLRLLLVGSPGSGRFSLANLLIGQPGLLPASPLPRLPLRVRLAYGETTTVELTDSTGIPALVPPDTLRTLLTATDAVAASGDPQSAAAQTLTIATNTDLLRTSELAIETIGAAYPPAAWKELLAGTDFVLLVLNAAALLSEQERRFIRAILQPDFGLERVAILVNQMDQVAADERAAIAEQVRVFLGPFERQPLLLEISAARAAVGLAEGAVPADSGYSDLLQFVQGDLVGQQRTLKAAALRQAAEMCLAELTAAVQRQQVLLTTDEAELRRLLDQLDPKSDWLKTRTDRLKHRIAAFVNTLLKEELLREIEAFSATLHQQLPGEVEAVDDLQAIKRHLPGYVEALWNEFFGYALPRLRSKLIDELQQIGDVVADDVQELLGGKAADFGDLTRRFDPVPPSMQAFLMPSRGKHPAGTAATWLQAGGLGLLMLVPALPFSMLLLGQASLAMIGAGQAMRMVYQRDITTADKQAVVTSLLTMTDELERQIRQQAARHFAGLTEELQEAVANLYTEAIGGLRAALEQDIARHTAVTARQEEVRRLADETLPHLRQMFAHVAG